MRIKRRAAEKALATAGLPRCEFWSPVPPASYDVEREAAHRRLVDDLAEHAALLATIGEQDVYPFQTVARAARAAATARASKEGNADPGAH